jgi:ATP-dependent exoDNAse (exonuclease V) beta subunit
MKNVEFINAGAGSGKTYTLVNLLADYLAGEKGNFKPSEVILTTFTDLAAAEFREKAREALLKRKLFDKASLLDSAAIGTVHSIAYGFVRKYWYLLGRGPADNVMSEDDQRFFMNQSLAGLASDDDIRFFGEVMKEFGFSRFDGKKKIEDTDFWMNHLRVIIEKMQQYDITDLRSSLDRSNELLDRIFMQNVTINEATVLDILKKYIVVCKANDRREITEKIVKDGSLKYCFLADLASLAPKGNENQLVPEIDSVIADAAMAVRSRHYGAKLRMYNDRVFGLAAKWKDEYNLYKVRNRLIDYNDMESLFLELLMKQEVQEEIRRSFKLVFVDEFQDSSPLQVKIFDRLSDLVEKSIWVGDPKQAIYGFRGSDALLIKAITGIFNNGDDRNNLTNGEPLGNSYRSRKRLVDLANSVFIRAFDDLKPDKVKLTATRNDAVDFGKNPEAELTHWHLTLGSERANSTDHYQNLAQQVIRVLNDRKKVYDKSLSALREIQPHDIAILCRSRREVNEIASILQEYGIKTTGQTADMTFFETAEVKLFLAIVNYMLNNLNDLAKAEILYLCDSENHSVADIITSRLGYLPARNEALAQRDASEEPDTIPVPRWEDENPIVRRLNDVAGQIRALPVPDLVEALIVRLDLKTLVSQWGNGDRRMKNLEALMKHAVTYDQRCLQMGLGASLNNFAVYLASLGQQGEKAEKVEGAVNVLTYHKAKGLEWNMVILESLDEDELNEDDVIFKSYFGVNDVLTGLPSADNLFPERYIQLLPWFPGAKKKVQPDIKALITASPEYANIVVELTAEIKRLMYVGVTRARDFLITVSYHNKKLEWLKNIGCSLVAPGECTDNTIDLWNTGIKSELVRCFRDPDFTGIQAEENERRPVKPDETTEGEPRYLSPSKIIEDLIPKVELVRNLNARIAVAAGPGNEGEGPSDAQIGTCLHDIFCIYQPGSSDNNGRMKTVLQNRHMLSVFPEPERIIASMDNLYGYLSEAYGAPIKVYRELPLQMQTPAGQVLRGSCDLVWETRDGCVIVDYKSYPGGLNDILTPGGERYVGIYAIQLKAYRKVLEEAGKKVIDTLIFYAVSGILIKISINA